METKEQGTTTLGIQGNIAALICYLGGFVTGLIFMFIEKENKFVRFHAVQSIAVFGGLFILNMAIGLILPWSLKGAFSSLIGVLSFVLWIVLMVKAYQGEEFRLPVAGDIAEKKS
jgi:uncharacterized membrane protein